MKCPCGAKSSVTNTRDVDVEAVKRLRICTSCGKQLRTIETVAVESRVVVVQRAGKPG